MRASAALAVLNGFNFCARGTGCTGKLGSDELVAEGLEVPFKTPSGGDATSFNVFSAPCWWLLKEPERSSSARFLALVFFLASLCLLRFDSETMIVGGAAMLRGEEWWCWWQKGPPGGGEALDDVAWPKYIEKGVEEWIGDCTCNLLTRFHVVIMRRRRDWKTEEQGFGFKKGRIF